MNTRLLLSPSCFAFVLTLSSAQLISPSAASAKTAVKQRPESVSKTSTVKAARLVYQGDGKRILNLVLSPDGKRLLVRGASQAIALDVETGQDVSAPGVAAQVPTRAGSLSPDGSEVLSPRYDFWLQIFNASSGKLRAEIVPLAVAYPSATQWSPDGKSFAVASANHVDILDSQTTKRVAGTLKPIGVGATSLSFSPDGSLLAAGFSSKNIEIYSTKNFNAPGFVSNAFLNYPQLKSQETLDAHSGPVSVLQWSKKGQELIAGDAGGVISFWDVANAKRLKFLPLASTEISGLSLSPDQKTLAVAAETFENGASVVLCDIASPYATREWRVRDTNQTVSASQVVFARDGQSVWVGSSAGSIWNVPLAAFKAIKQAQVSTSIPNAKNSVPIFKGEMKDVQALIFSNDGRSVVAGNTAGELASWNLQSGEKTRLTSRHQQRITTLAFSPDGKLLASAGWSGLEMMEWKTGKVLWSIKGSWCGVAGFDATSKVLYATIGREVRELDAQSGALVRTLGRIEGETQKVALAPDRKRLALAFVTTDFRARSVFEELQVWDVGEARKLWDETFNGYIEDLSWSSDSRLLAFDNGDHSDGYPNGIDFVSGQMGYSVLDAATGKDTEYSNLKLKQPAGASLFLPRSRTLFHRRGK